MTIGILLPGSTLYPSIGMDFLQGLKSSFEYHKCTDLDFKIDIIGYGLKDEELYAVAEKYLIVDNAELVIAYLEDYHAAKLSPLFAAAGKLLIIVNAGANYPDISISQIKNTIFQSLNDSLCCFLTGKHVTKKAEGITAIMATSFFDGGYRHTHAMTNAFTNSGGTIEHNYVSHYKKEAFNTDTLTTFIEDRADVKNLLAIFSGDSARFFYEKLADISSKAHLNWYCSPMMFDCTPGDFEEAKPDVPMNIRGYTFWVPELENKINHTFLEYYRAKNNKEANLFSMQGWETALLVMEYLQQLKNTPNCESAIIQLISKEIKSPRGTIFINKERYIIAPAYLVSASGKLQITIEETISDTTEPWQEMVAQIPDELYTSWRNTYLCI